MIESVKTFFKDMNEADQHQREFLKKHWKGYLVYSVGTTLVVWGMMLASTPEGREYVKDEVEELKNKFHKKEES